MAAERSVLHVLPHPGGGGETYVDLLEAMPGYRFTRVYLAPSPRPSALELARGVASAHRRGRGYDLVHVHGDVAAMLCMPLLAWRPSIVTFNGLHLARRLHGRRYRGVGLALRAVVRITNRTICVCEAELDYLRAIGGEAAARRAVVIHNGVGPPVPASEADRAKVRDELGISGSEPVGIWVGSLDERKDPLVAIRAAQRASITLLVVGDGPLRPEVEQAATGSVRFLGQRDDVPRLLAASDIFVLTTQREGFAFSLLEAMAHALPPVATDLPENVEAIGDAGIAVPLNDDDALSAAIHRLAENVGERLTLGIRAAHRVAELFQAGVMVRQTRAAYDDCRV